MVEESLTEENEKKKTSVCSSSYESALWTQWYTVIYFLIRSDRLCSPHVSACKTQATIIWHFSEQTSADMWTWTAENEVDSSKGTIFTTTKVWQNKPEDIDIEDKAAYMHKDYYPKSENSILSLLPQWKDRIDVRGGISQWAKIATPFREVEKATPIINCGKLNHGDSSSFIHGIILYST